MNSEEFRTDNRNLYIQRSGATMCSQGKEIDLTESLERLKENSLIENDPELIVCWGKKSRSMKVGNASRLMKTIFVNPILDKEDIDEEALDYAIYSLICQVRLGFKSTREGEKEKYEEMMLSFPNAGKSIEQLRLNGVDL